MSNRSKFWGVLLLFFLLALAVAGAILWQALREMPSMADEMRLWLQNLFVLLLFALFCLALLLLQVWSWLDRVLMRPLSQLDRSMAIMANADPNHHHALRSDHLLGDLPTTARQLAAALFYARRQVKEALTHGMDGLERLERLIKNLHIGLVVINSEAGIVLYNAAAQNLFRHRAEFLGLGRSFYELCARMPVETTMTLLTHCNNQQECTVANGVRFFCAVVGDERMLDCRMSLLPVDGSKGKMQYLITLEEAAQSMAALRQGDLLIHHGLENMRGPVANLRAAAETMLLHPEMEPEVLGQFVQVVYDEGKLLSEHLEWIAGEADALAVDHWLQTDVLSSDLLAGLQRRLERHEVIRLQVIGEPLWLRADAPALLLALEKVLLEAVSYTEEGLIEVETLMGDRRVYLDFIWHGRVVPATEVESWSAISVADAGAMLSVQEILDRHGCQLWCRAHRREGYALLRVPVTTSPRQWQLPEVEMPERPEFYDFSLMDSFAGLGRLVGRSLSSLNYVVFDTETTGLHPSKGDEIISIAGLRIVNGRTLTGEKFERLINPGRPIPAESTKIHGLSDADVQDKPTIAEVLPQFKEFVGDAVLVAHNAAFDMKFLQMKESVCEIRFDNPVLDTLLLSVYLHEEVTDHTLDAIAERLGVSIHDRHTAMGDTEVTAEVFLKLLELMKAKGISTLGLAMQASQSMVQIRRQQAKANY
ncbi:3'-5' exonuclease [Candidatus Magnetaquicoccus inordinatus]|uniref:3'-5' exonuclease n=1 Tax=Candidatus Magnetaquicoccus inordinatus TaxID=2496818 RepID=UPI00102B3279|nr:exonuclease domain-containing protein [Candidatus Magnetaquicoccus inordinatus]